MKLGRKSIDPGWGAQLSSQQTSPTEWCGHRLTGGCWWNEKGCEADYSGRGGKGQTALQLESDAPADCIAGIAVH